MRWVLVLVVSALAACVPAFCDAWPSPMAFTEVGVRSELFVEGVHEVGGWKIDYVEAEYRALLSFREEEPVTLHVLLPEGTEVLRAWIHDVSSMDIAMNMIPPGGTPVKPVGRSEVTWCFDGRSWTWEQLDFRLVPDSKYMVLVLDLRIPTVHMSAEEMDRWIWNHMVVPKMYDAELGSEYERGVVEWPVPAYPSGPLGFKLFTSGSVKARVELFLWPGGVVTRPPSAPSWETFQVFLTRHLALVFPDASVLPVTESGSVDVEREIVESEWPEVTGRFGFPYVPVVAVLSFDTGEGAGSDGCSFPFVSWLFMPAGPGVDQTASFLRLLLWPLL